MSERLTNRHTLTVDSDANEPVTSPPEVRYCRILELSVTVCTHDQQVTWVMADFRVKMVDLKVRFAVSFFESEGAKLTLPIMCFTKQNANSRGDALTAFGRTRRRAWTRAACRLLRNAQQFSLGELSRPFSRQSRQRI